MRDDFPEYATTVALRGEPPIAASVFGAHLDACTICRDELGELTELTSAAYAGRIARALPYPVANLSFLPQPRTAVG